jgi:colicin import membrane protein
VKERGEAPPGLEKPRARGGFRAFVLAVIVHAAFFALIVFGVSWQSSPPTPVVAEIWDKLPPAKTVEKAPEPAKPPEPPKPEPEPPKPEPPKPEPPKPEPPKPEPEPPKKVEPPKPDPAIIEKLEREKREKEKRERLEREREEKKKQEEVRKKQEEARKKQEELEAARKKKKEEEARRAEEERLRREAEKAREAAAAAQKREFDEWVDKIRIRIRGKANVPDSVTGHPEVHMRLRILPGGEVLEATVVKSSGNPVYDQAIERAIRSASPLPVPPANSELFHQFRNLNLNIRHER